MCVCMCVCSVGLLLQFMKEGGGEGGQKARGADFGHSKTDSSTAQDKLFLEAMKEISEILLIYTKWSQCGFNTLVAPFIW